MNLSVRSTGTWQHTLDIEVPVDEVDRRLEEVARQIQRRASLPGFRKGRVPLDLVRHHFAEMVEQEFLETFVPRLTNEAIDQARLTPVVTPVVRDLKFVPGQPLRFASAVRKRASRKYCTSSNIDQKQASATAMSSITMLFSDWTGARRASRPPAARPSAQPYRRFTKTARQAHRTAPRKAANSNRETCEAPKISVHAPAMQ